jgi:hypothetical protein
VTGPRDQAADAAQALARLSPARADDYHQWIAIGMSLAGLGDVGLALWDSWSRQSSKYREGECERKWRTFRPDGGVTIRSLHAAANQDSRGAR